MEKENKRQKNRKLKKKKRFSIRTKLILIFGLLGVLGLVFQVFFAVRTSRQAVTENVEAGLIEKAADTSEIIDGKITSFLNFIEFIAFLPEIRSSSVSYADKMKRLNEEAKQNPMLSELYIVDSNGIQHNPDGLKEDYSEDLWFKQSIEGKKYCSEPYRDSTRENSLLVTFSIPVYDDDKNIIGVLGADVFGTYYASLIEEIVIGETGYCFIVGENGTVIAHKDFSRVESMANLIEEAKSDKSLEDYADFLSKAIADNGQVGYFQYKGTSMIAAHSKIKNTGWVVIVRAPAHEFLGIVESMQAKLIIIGLVTILILFAAVFFVARKIVKPLKATEKPLKEISEGNLTVRLPTKGNDEITELLEFFNKTIEQLQFSLQSVDGSAKDMEGVGSELASSMRETAAAVQQISSAIDGVKQQTLTQAESVTETAATMEEIIQTIRSLNISIENQSEVVAESSVSVEQMVADISSITNMLEENNNAIKELTSATNDGKATMTASNSVTQKIAEESGGLLEASSVIQHIASQTTR